MCRKRRGRRAAIKAARLSDFYAHRVGVAIFKGASQIAIGYNRHKTHPLNTCYTQHAEFNSILKSSNRSDYKNLTMYVARLTRTDKISLSKPCPECQKTIWDVGIRKVYYTDHEGELEELIFDFELQAA